MNIYTDFKKEFVQDFHDFYNIKDHDDDWKLMFLSYVNTRYQKENNKLLLEILEQLKRLS